MRLSGLALAVLLFTSASLVAQHSSGGGGHSGGGSSGGFSGAGSGSFGGYSSAGSSHSTSSSGSSHASGSVSSSSSASRSTGSAKTGPSAKSNAQTGTTEKKSFFSFLRHKKPELKPARQALAFPPIRCRKGENCGFCAGGTRSATGQCIHPTQYSCSAGQAWNGFSCGAQSWLNDCRELQNELEMQRLRMQGDDDPAESFRYRMLLNQYQQCAGRFGAGYFSWNALGDSSLSSFP